MTDQDLQRLVEQVSLQAFHQPFVNQARFNARLRTTGGRFHLGDGHLDFNPTLFAASDATVQAGIIKHELCHYHLYRARRGYKHRDADFKQLLTQVGGLRYAPRLTATPVRYRYCCPQCGTEYLRQRRLNLSRYACGRCGHRLEGPLEG
ncbi:SprT family protein [Lacticaseibacillus daqingensis]|uniref:SprT family protein n=1 Tax=Lacticaseibacillus daqingensis TaxID=2486014 RepID=UPI000F7B9F6B|nr:SprT family protein [Lacticaseibacillus daqingensis]